MSQLKANDCVSGLRVIITGGASGMGEALVRHFARQGAQVILFDVNDAAGESIALAASAAGAGQADFLHCDVSDEASVTAAFAEAVARLGGLDCLIHAAGIAPGAPAEQITVEGWDTIFAVNARGTFLTNQAAFAYLKAGGGSGFG